MNRLKLILCGLPFCLIILWLAGSVLLVVSEEPVVKSITFLLVVVAAVPICAYGKRKLGIQPAPCNRCLWQLVRLPFSRFPSEVKIGFIFHTPPDSPSPEPLPDDLAESAYRAVWSVLEEDLLVCKACRKRCGEFIAEFENELAVEPTHITCAACYQERTGNRVSLKPEAASDTDDSGDTEQPTDG